MATYKEIQAYIKDKQGFSVKTCWIADAKNKCGLNPRMAPNRHDPNSRVHPCPDTKLDAIKEQILFFKERSLKRAYTRAIAYYYSTACSFLKQAKKAQYEQEAKTLKKLIDKHKLRYGFRLMQYRLQKK